MKKIKQLLNEKPLWVRIILLFLGTYVLKAFIMQVSSIVISLLFNIPEFNQYIYTDETGIAETLLPYIMMVIVFVVTILIIYMIKPYRPVLKTLGTKLKGNNIKMFCIGGILGLGINSIVVIGALLNNEIQLELNSFHFVIILFILVIVLLQCLAEEFIHRGIIQHVTAKYFNNPILIIGLNALLFGMGHGSHEGVNINGVLTLIFLGIACAAFVYYTDSLWAATALHGFWNFSQAILWGLPNSGQPASYTIFKLTDSISHDSFFYSPTFGPEGATLAVILLAILSIVMIVWGVKSNRKMTNIWE